LYRVVTDSEAAEQIAALPAEALPSFAEAFGVLELTPWNGRPYNESKPDGEMRELVFAYWGTVTYLVLEQQREVHILLVQWVG
jgi:hypothetical protein